MAASRGCSSRSSDGVFMNICFYGMNSGLANNGGSRTIIKSAETLNRIGHYAWIVAKKNKYTWHKYNILEMPAKKADVVVAIAAVDVKDLHKAYPDHKKAWWIRGFELWTMKEEDLLSRARMDHINIVNSTWLQNHLKSRGIESHLCYQGIDFEEWGDYGLRSNTATVIGYLGKTKHKTKNYDFCLQLKERFKNDPKFDFVEFPKHNTMVGLHGHRARSGVPANFIYNMCHIWFSPTCLEGLHNPPMESAMCGCLIVGSDHPRNGMSDYLTEDTGMIYKYGSSNEAYISVIFPDYDKIPKMQELIRDKIGSREKNMKRFVELLENG